MVINISVYFFCSISAYFGNPFLISDTKGQRVDRKKVNNLNIFKLINPRFQNMNSNTAMECFAWENKPFF